MLASKTIAESAQPNLFGQQDTLCGAWFSGCRTYRYSLWRRWCFGDGAMMVIGLNPSTADEVLNDPTVSRLITRARVLGFETLLMTNLFAYRSTDPRGLKEIPDPVGKDNNDALLECASRSKMIIAAWGKHGTYQSRADRVTELLLKAGHSLHSLDVSKKTGIPKHPLYLPYELKPVIWRTPQDIS